MFSLEQVAGTIPHQICSVNVSPLQILQMLFWLGSCTVQLLLGVGKEHRHVPGRFNANGHEPKDSQAKRLMKCSPEHIRSLDCK